MAVTLTLAAALLLGLVVGTPARAADVSYGSRGAVVAAWQHELNATHAYRLAEDGVFGRGTYAATVDFQWRVGLPQSGRVDGWTRKLMRDWLAPANPQAIGKFVFTDQIAWRDSGALKVALANTRIPWSIIDGQIRVSHFTDSSSAFAAQAWKVNGQYVIQINRAYPYGVPAHTFAHEIGHLFDAAYVSGVSSYKVRCIENVVPGSWWDTYYEDQLGEAFAQMFVNLYTAVPYWHHRGHGTKHWTYSQESLIRDCVENRR